MQGTPVFQNKHVSVHEKDFTIVACVHNGKSASGNSFAVLINEGLMLLLCHSCAAMLKANYLEDLFRQSMAETIMKARHAAAEGEEDLLFKTARTLLDFYNQYGPDEFKAHFGVLGVLDECRRIMAEGEGNPHPWPGAD